MGLRVRVMLLIGVTIAAVLAAHVAISRFVLLPRFEQLQQRQAEQDHIRVRALLRSDAEGLARLCEDWALWDDAYAFVAAPNDDFVESNIHEGILDSLDLDVLHIRAADGVGLWGRHRNDADGDIPAKGADAAPLAAVAQRMLADMTPRHGVVRDGETLVILAFQPITRSDGSGPANGGVLMARRIDTDQLADFQERAQVELHIERIETRGAHPTRHGGAVDGFVSELRDIFDRPAGQLHTLTPDAIVAGGRAMLRNTTLLVAAFSLMLLAGAWGTLDRMVLRPIDRLRGHTRAVLSGQSQRLELDAVLEFRDLAAAFDLSIEELNAARLFLQAAIDSMAAHIAVLDEAGDIALVNESWRRFALDNGLRDPDELLGMNYVAVCSADACGSEPTEDTQGAADAGEGVRHVLAGELAAFYLEYPCHSPTEWRWFALRVTPFTHNGRRWAAVAHENITDRKRAEVRLAEREEQLEMALEGSEAGLWDWNFTAGVTYFNDRWWRMLGYEPDELPSTRTTWEQLIHADDRVAVLDALTDHLDGRAPVLHVECRMRCADGSYRWMMNRAKLMQRETTDCFERLVGTQVDVTERKEIELRLKEAKLAAEAANDAKTTFLANMSHEIRTPLTAILGYADLLTTTGSPSERTNHIETIKRNGDHLLQVINNILDLSKIESGKLEFEPAPTNVCELIEVVASMMQVRAAAKGIVLKTEYRWPLPQTVTTDPVRVRQVLVNIVGNAIKFTERGGVRIIVRYDRDASPSKVSIEVADSGIGMTTEQVDRLFQPFVQADASTSRRFGGTGLGLAIAQRLTRMLGGDLAVHSVPGEGTSFVLTLPVASVDQALLAGPEKWPARPRADADAQPDNLAGRVLLAEDGPDNQLLVSLLLRRAGLEVDVVEDGQLALHRALDATEAGQPYDVLLMDMQMPRMDGYEATQRLRESGYTGPVVALTAHAMASDRERCLAAGCDDFSAKPVNEKHLLRLIAKLLAKPTAA